MHTPTPILVVLGVFWHAQQHRMFTVTCTTGAVISNLPLNHADAPQRQRRPSLDAKSCAAISQL